MPSTTSNLCQAKASYKKIPGLLELTKSHLTWTATGKQKADLRIPTNQAACELSFSALWVLFHNSPFKTQRHPGRIKELNSANLMSTP